MVALGPVWDVVKFFASTIPVSSTQSFFLQKIVRMGSPGMVLTAPPASLQLTGRDVSAQETSEKRPFGLLAIAPATQNRSTGDDD